MFDKYKKAEVTNYRGPQRRAYGYKYEVVQGNRRVEAFRANEHEDALAKAERINADLPAANRRRIVRAVAGTALLATSAVTGFSILNHSEDSTPKIVGIDPPVPTETQLSTPTSTPTESSTEAPQHLPQFRLSNVIVTLSPKPHHHPHDKTANGKPTHTTPEVPAPETPAPTYEPPQDTYTPPPVSAAKLPQAPHFTVHHLKEH